MTGFDISKYPTKAIQQLHKEVSEEILDETKTLLKKYDFKHELEAELAKRGHSV